MKALLLLHSLWFIFFLEDHNCIQTDGVEEPWHFLSYADHSQVTIAGRDGDISLEGMTENKLLESIPLKAL